MLKKIIACMLIVVMLLSIGVINVFADFYYTPNMYSEEAVYQENGWEVYCTIIPGEPTVENNIIGEYMFQSGHYSPSKIGVYAVKDDTVVTFENAYETGEIQDMDAFVESYLLYSEDNETYLGIIRKGDIDNNKNITINDVLEYQKDLANYKSAYRGFDYEFTFDFNSDDVVNVADILMIQMYLTGKAV